MRSFLIAAACVALNLNLVVSSGEFQCYSCASVEGIEVPPGFESIFDPSCKNGSTPEDRFLITCSDDIQTSCSKLTLKGNFTNNPDSSEAEITLRTCIALSEDMKGSCKELTVAETKQIPNFPEDLFLFLELYTDKSIADHCFCDQSACNKENNETLDTKQ